MSYEMRREERGEKDISRTATEGNEQKEFNGFEGMNFEQVRQPYNENDKGRNRSKGERGPKRPDEA